MADDQVVIIAAGAVDHLRTRFGGRPVPELSWATVTDYCEYRDELASLCPGTGDLKDVQRAWAVATALGVVPPGGAVLEFGCGEPIVLGALAELGYRAIGVDPFDGSGFGPTEVARAAARFPEVTLVVDRYGEGSGASAFGPFDAVASVSVLEHLPLHAVDDVFATIARDLRPGGWSIHCVDVVVEGTTSEHHLEVLDRVLTGQSLVAGRQPGTRPDAEAVAASVRADIDAFYLPAEGYRMWRENGDTHPYRRVVSVQSCVRRPREA